MMIWWQGWTNDDDDNQDAEARQREGIQTYVKIAETVAIWDWETVAIWGISECSTGPNPLKMWDPTGSYPTQNKKWTVHCSAPNLPRSETPQVPLEGQSKPQQRLQITLKMIVVWLPPPSRFNWLFKDYSQLPKKERLTENCNENAPLDPNLLLQKPHWLPLKDIQNFRRESKKDFFAQSRLLIQNMSSLVSNVLLKSDNQIIVFMPKYTTP